MSAEGPVTVVVPATGEAPFLERVIAALRAAMRDGDELLVVREPAGCSPAHARNLGAMEANHDLLVFVDADVTVHADALDRLRAAFADPELCAAFGAYDDDPPGGVVARFRNLLHHHVHRS